jgi:hypothetical protein
MHAFAILAFGGLATALAVRMLSSYGREMSGASKVVLWVGLGVGFAYLANFSIFDAWHIAVRSHTVGAIMTGFMTGGMALLWEEAIAYLSHYYHRDEKKSLRRAA